MTELFTIPNAAKVLGLKKEVIQYHVEIGNIELIDGKLSSETVDAIRNQQNTFIGIKEFLVLHDNNRFVSKLAKHRNKYIDFLETNDYFGIEIIEPEEILYNIPGKEDFYITKEDAQLLEFESERFFSEYGLSEEEKIRRIILISHDNKECCEYINKYLEYIYDKGIYTPALTSFVRTACELPDIKGLTDEDILYAIENIEVKVTKKHLINFLNYVARFENVKYHEINVKKKEKGVIQAYSYETFIDLARILFNETYDKEHNLTLKALDNSKYVETWMFLSCHYICGWRASDICDRWIYPDLKSNNNPFGINFDTIREDIITGKISEEIYDKVALYSVKKIELSNNSPHKTGMGKLRSSITPDLLHFFGKLILIAEYHHFTSGKGYMNSNRITKYQNWVMLREFFGYDIDSITDRRPISSRRLNKSYLQGMEKTAIENGNTTLVAHVIASFARNHSDINTTLTYLKDHGLTGESAEVVLYMMMQRGVFSVSLYNALIAAYPEAFEKLSAKEQTAIMEKIPLSAYELETVGTSLMASEKMAEVFAEGKTEEPIEILKAMYAIAQGKGKAKDSGIYCKRKALGLCCEHPAYESCLANLCPYHVFTSDGVPALIRVIKDYQQKEFVTGNKKYSIALKTKIIPAFQDIINAIIKEMSEEERTGTKRLIEEALNG